MPTRAPGAGSLFSGWQLVHRRPFSGRIHGGCLAEHPGLFDGLVMLAAYSTQDFSQLDVKVLNILASEDQVLNQSKYETGKALLPAGFEELVIEGGCHAGFGLYGPQAGDGTVTMIPQAQPGGRIQDPPLRRDVGGALYMPTRVEGV